MNIEDIGRPAYLIVPLLLVFAPAGLVLKQPDLGTAVMLYRWAAGLSSSWPGCGSGNSAW